MPNYECSTCDYCDKNRKQGNKVRCIRFSKFVEGLSICKEFTNKEYEEATKNFTIELIKEAIQVGAMCDKFLDFLGEGKTEC